MAAVSLPTLSWTLSSTASLSSANGPAIIDEIDTLITASSDWQVASKDSGSAYIEISPTSSDAGIQNCRIIIHDGTLTSGKTASDTPNANALHIGLAPEGGAGSLGTADSSDPYSDGKFTGYNRILSTVTTMDYVWIIHSAEVLVIAFSNGDNVYGAVAGAWIKAPDDGVFSGSDHRIWALATSGSAMIGSSGRFWNDDQAWMGGHASTSDGNAHVICFHPSEGLQYLRRVEEFQNVDDTNTSNAARLTDAHGSVIGLPFHFHMHDSPRYFVGSARQMSVAEDRMHRTTQSSDGSIKRIVWAMQHSGGAADALGFDN